MVNTPTQAEQVPAPDKATDPVAYTAAEQAADTTTQYSVSGGLLNRLHKLNISIALTSYQSGLLYLIGRNKRGWH